MDIERVDQKYWTHNPYSSNFWRDYGAVAMGVLFGMIVVGVIIYLLVKPSGSKKPKNNGLKFSMSKNSPRRIKSVRFVD